VLWELFPDHPNLLPCFETPRGWDFGGNRPVIGNWVVDGEPAGIGIREDAWITGNTARFVPHVFAV